MSFVVLYMLNLYMEQLLREASAVHAEQNLCIFPCAIMRYMTGVQSAL